MCDISETAFSIGSSLELLATVASMPNEGAVLSSHLFEATLLSDTTEILLRKSPSAKSLSLPTIVQPEESVTISEPSNLRSEPKKRHCGSLSPVARRICLRLNSLRNKMNVKSAKVCVSPRYVAAVISRVENDLVRLLGKRVFRSQKCASPKSSPCCCSRKQDFSASVVSENPAPVIPPENKFVDEGTQTQIALSPTPALDIDILDPTVDFTVSVPCIQEHALVSPKIESSLNIEIEASGQLLDSFLEKVEQSEQSSVQTSSEPQIPPEANNKVFDPKEHQLTPTFINMFWNTFSALKADTGLVFIRLADISATALPAKDSSILKQRCNKLAIPVYSCTDLQRNFLVNYCFGSSCRSVFMVECQAAKILLASYCQDKMKEHGLSLNDMQVVVLSEEDSQRLISSRLLCSTKYLSNGTMIPNTVTNDNNGIVLRRRTVSAPPTPPPESSRKKIVKSNNVTNVTQTQTLAAEPQIEPVKQAEPLISADSETCRQRLWSSAQIYNASVVDTVVPVSEQIVPHRKRRRRGKDCFDISKPPKRRRLPSRSTKHTQIVGSNEVISHRKQLIPLRFAAVLVPRSTPITIRAVGQTLTSSSTCKTGILTPHLFVVPYAPCVQCIQCHSILSPLAFARHCGGKKLRPECLAGDLERKEWTKFCQKLRQPQGKINNEKN